MKRTIAIKVKDFAAAINAVGEANNDTKLHTICWDCNMGGVFQIAAKSAEEARQIVVQRIESGEYTHDDLEVVEERIYDYNEIKENLP